MKTRAVSKKQLREVLRELAATDPEAFRDLLRFARALIARQRRRGKRFAGSRSDRGSVKRN